MEWSKLGFQPKPKTLVIGEEIGRGSWGTVCRGILDGKPVAVKRLPRVLLEVLEESSYHNLMQQFSHECKFLKSIDHLNIVNFIGAYYDEKTQEPMLVMELMEGDLSTYLNRVDGHLSVIEQCKVCKDVASALVYLHKQDPPIAHCDVIRRNILLSADGHVKLSDFGCAQRKPACGYYDTTAPGALPYMPPEALREQCAYDEKIDVFSLGVVMTEVATQSPPSVRLSDIGKIKEIERRLSDLSKIPDDHPLKPIILRCLQDDPKDRPNSAAVLKELEKVSPVSKREWVAAYEEALEKQGSVSVEVTRCLFIGPPAVGKSSLKHLLIHNKSKAVETSTPVMEVPDVMRVASEQYAVEDGASYWQLLEGNAMKQSIQLTALRHGYQVKHSISKSESHQPPSEATQPSRQANFFGRLFGAIKFFLTRPFVQRPSVESVHSQPVNAESLLEVPNLPAVIPDHESIDNQNLSSSGPSSVLEEVLSGFLDSDSSVKDGVELDHASFVHLLDSGGQPCFLDTLPLLLSVPCTYILVFNASQDLDEALPVSYRAAKDSEEILPSSQTGRDLMQRMMSSFHTMAAKHSKEMSQFQEHGAQPPQLRIHLIGTFKDVIQQTGRLEDQSKSVSVTIQSLSFLPTFDHIVKDPQGCLFHLINNNLTANQECSPEELEYIAHLRSSLSQRESALKMDVPLMWYLLQQVVQRAGQKLMRYTELRDFAMKHQMVASEQQFSSFVELFTLLGFFAYFNFPSTPDESKWVCTDATFFYREVSKLLSIQFTNVCSPESNRFKQTGIIGPSPSSVLEELQISKEMDPEWLFKSLVHTGIAADIDGTCQKLFIPATLPSQDQPLYTTSLSVVCASFKVQKDAFSPQYINLPQGLYCRIIVELANKGLWTLCPEESTRTSVKFLWSDSQILLLENTSRLEVVVTFHESFLPPTPCKDAMTEVHDHCCSVLNEVKTSMKKVADDMFGERNPDIGDVVVGFQCRCDGTMGHLAVVEYKKQSMRCMGGEMKDKFQKLSLDQLIWFKPIQPSQAKLILQDHGRLNYYVMKELNVSKQVSSNMCLDRHIDDTLVRALPDLRCGLSLDGLLPRLEKPAGGFMTKTERMKVEAIGNPPDRVSEIVGILRTKTNEDFHHFLSILKESGNEHWSTNLRDSVVPSLCEATQPVTGSFRTEEKVFDVESFALRCKPQFLSDVSTEEIVEELEKLKLIPGKLRRKIESVSSREEANRLLLDHVCANFNTESLTTLCKVMCEEEGYPKMNDLGKRMLSDLPS